MTRRLYILFFVICAVFDVVAQPSVSDFQSWGAVTLSADITNRISVSDEVGLRFRNNSTSLHYFYTVPALSYRVNDSFSIGIGWLWGSRTSTGVVSYRNRFLGEIEWERSIHRPFSFAWRSRIQDTHADIFSSADGRVNNFAWRNRLEISGDYDRYVPYIQYETYAWFGGQGIYRHRLGVGSSMKITRNAKIRLGYLYQQEPQDSPSSVIHALRIDFTVKIVKK